MYGKAALNLGLTKDDSKSAVQRNRAAFLAEVGAKCKSNSGSSLWPLVMLRQIHSDIIRFVEPPVESQLVGDGLVTNTPGLLLAIQTADCLPIILVDSEQPCRGRISRRVAGHDQADRGKGSGRDAAQVRQPGTRS